MNRGETGAAGRDVKGGGLTDLSYQGCGGGRAKECSLISLTLFQGTGAHLCVQTELLQQGIKPVSHDNSTIGVENIIITSWSQL